MPRPGNTGAAELRAIARDLRVAGSPGRGLRAELRRNITIAGKPMVAEAKSNAIAIPTTGSKHTGLRKAIARSVRMNMRIYSNNTRVRIMADGRRMPAGKGKLPAYMEGSDGFRAMNWRHPVYGNDNVWVPQASHRYFQPAIDHHLPEVYDAVMAAVDETRLKLLTL